MMPFSRCSLALLSCLFGVFSSISSADFAGASYTEEVINPGEITYKIYLNYTNPLDKQLAVSGNANFSALQLTASSDLIQKHLVPTVPADVPGPLALPGDSWVTIGEGDANGQETQFSSNLFKGQGDAFGALISGDGFIQDDNGGYFDSNPSTSVEGTQILIAQFTFVPGTTWTFTGTSDFNANGTDLTAAAFSVSNIGSSDDCDGNGLDDSDEILVDPSLDCDDSGSLDSCEIADGTLQDCNGNGLPDVCSAQGDCNANGIEDYCESDCDFDGFIDPCDLDDDGDGILDDPCDAEICGVVIGVDCDANGLLDTCDISDGAADCDGNGVLDTCDLADGAADCDGNGILDRCQPDCDGNGVADACDPDCDNDGIPDACEPDDDDDGIPDECDSFSCGALGARVINVAGGQSHHSIGLREDGTIACWGLNNFGQCDAPDGVFTQVAGGESHSIGLREDGTVACWGSNLYGECDAPEEFQIPSTTKDDCDGNGVLDTCDLADGAADCDSNGILDRCEPDCDGNGVADACDVDCDNDGIPDACDNDDDGDGLDDACDGEICGVVINDADMNGVRDDCEPCSPSLFLPIEVDEMQYNPGEISYRIHLRTPSVFDQVLAVSGDADISMLEFLADAELIQHELVSGTVLGDTPTAGFVLPGDSWVTIGPEGAEDTAFSPGFLGGDGATSVINGSSWSSSDNRGYFDAYPLTQVEGGRVLIAQFTLPEGAKFRYRGSVNFECGGEELARRPFRWSNDAEDCDANGEEDWVDLLDPANDCNSNGVVDICEFGGVNDCDSNGIPDECEPDCDGDGTTDACDSDDDGDGTPDECDADSCGVVDGAADCDSNGILDSCEPDCDGDGTIDACDLDDDGDGTPDECDADSCGLTLEDCDGNGVFDGCDPDCDVDGTPDACDLDDDGDGIPDECDADSCGVVGDDCDGNGVLDSCDPDCDTDGVPDACEDDCDTDGVPDDCETDCDSDGTPDDCDDDDDDDEIPDDCDADNCGFLGDDCDGDGVLDTCQLDPSTDCDNSGTLDVCDLADDPGLDCDANGLLDFCQVLEMPESDCDANLIPDTCDQDAGAADANADGILDRCQCGDSGQTLPHPGPFAGESFGRSVDLDGNRAVVGVRDGEACYVFRFDGLNWVFEDFLISEDLDGDSEPDIAGLTNGWGQAVKIAGDSIAVGARLYNIPGTPPQFNAGIVVTFRFDNGAWVEDSRLAPPDQFEGDIFGESLDFEETVLVASAPGADDSAEDAGEIHLFSRSLVDGWQWQQVYRPAGLAAGDRFGKAVAVEGELVVASATGDDDQGPQTGALHVSLRTSGSMIPLDKLYSPEPWASQEYGTELDLQGGRIAAGAPLDNRNGPAQGLVGLHEQDGSGNWTATAIRPDNPQDYEYFGASVALEGDFLVVGAPGDDQNPQVDPPPGAIYIFERLGLGDWAQRRRITLPTYPFGELGLATAVDSGRILSGALFDDRYGEDAGLARVFEIFPSLDCDGDGLCDLSQIFEPEFDCNFNGVVDVCELDATNDCDGNGVLDVCELDGRDCDDNGVLDSCDLAQGETDANCDGVLDVCQCLGDLNGSGVISFEDLVVLIAAWGELCPSSCPEDLNCNGVVDSADLLTILSQWGPCGG